MGSSIAILWAVLLFGIELAILGITEVRASLLSGAQNSTTLYFGFMALALMLPIIAGAIRWDAMRYIDRFKTTRAHREIDSRLAQIDSILRQNEEYESNFYKMKSMEYWDLLNEFRTLKDLYNERHSMVENLGGHFAQSYDAFQREAYKRYEADLRDLSSSSMRRLDVGERRTGEKLSQAVKMKSVAVKAEPDRSSAGRAPAERKPRPSVEAGPRNGDATANENDVYLAPKPVR